MPNVDTAANRREDLVRLIEDVAKGDRKALASVYERTSAKLYGVCVQIVRDREVAEDILQEVFLKVWNRAGRFDRNRASPVTWLCAVARNASIDWVRKHGVEDRPTVEPAGSTGGVISASIEAMAADQGRAQIFDCLESLPPNQRTAIRLAFFDGSSHSELATSMRAPLGTTKSWIRRGLLQLRGCLEDE